MAEKEIQPSQHPFFCFPFHPTRLPGWLLTEKARLPPDISILIIKLHLYISDISLSRCHVWHAYIIYIPARRHSKLHMNVFLYSQKKSNLTEFRLKFQFPLTIKIYQTSTIICEKNYSNLGGRAGLDDEGQGVTEVKLRFKFPPSIFSCIFQRFNKLLHDATNL